MTTISSLHTALRMFGLSAILHEMGQALADAVPEGNRFADDAWNVISWKRIKGRARELHVDFAPIGNPELREAAKVFILHSRTTRKLGGAGALLIASAIQVLDRVVPVDLPISELKNKHFNEAQDWLVENVEPGVSTPFTTAGHLSRFGRFMNRHAGLRISFIPSIPPPRPHGSSGTQKGRDERLIPIEILRDLLALTNVEELHLKDQFFLQTLLLFVATGFRLSELFTLPANCLIERNSTVGIRYFSVKVGKFDVKPVAGAFAPAVRAAVKWLQDVTEPGRVAALKARDVGDAAAPQHDWSYIFRNDEAIEYFVGQLLHAWTADPRNNLFNPAGAWFERDKAYVDVLSMIEQAGGNYAEVARQLNTAHQAVVYLKWAQEAMLRGELPPNSQRRDEKKDHYSDSRFISQTIVERTAGFLIKDKRAAKMRPLLREAQRLQLLGKSYPAPERNPDLERTYALRQRAVITDGEGRSRLEPHEALFVVEPHTLSYGRKPTKGKYTVVPGNTLVRWLGGEAKAEGTGRVTEAIFARFRIKDPRTGEVANFTSHQIRHWLNTMYLKGGLTSVEAALVMGHDLIANAIYDQRDFLEREAALRQAVRTNHAVGHIQDTYSAFADLEPEKAEEYLLSTLRRHSLMPHGACTRDLRRDPCPNQLSCFADQDRTDGGACQYLLVDTTIPGIAAHLEYLERQQGLLLEMLPPSSPQHSHARWTKNNVNFFLEALKMRAEQ